MVDGLERNEDWNVAAEFENRVRIFVFIEIHKMLSFRQLSRCFVQRAMQLAFKYILSQQALYLRSFSICIAMRAVYRQ